ncbi:MAG TPA: nucleoside triphosphate pyrophosphatase [Candidatus Bathyarchaeia archaeon]|nr:nucleoside triphosphate pyrophosphatase [Candidatus Bathyarchaeia archaeon]
MKPIILASASPRRKEILKKLGLKFKTEASNYQEEMIRDISPRKLARLLSLGKAKAVAKNHKTGLIIGADTFIILGKQLLGKPDTAVEAKKMLEKIGGRTLSVITGFTIIDTESGKTVSDLAETKVYIRKLTEAEVDNYVKSGEPIGKAGAFAIQGLGALIVERIEGDYYNVIGLPLCLLAEKLKQFGVRIL